MELERILQSQGFGTRRHCRALIASGQVRVDGTRCEDAAAVFDLTQGLELTIDEVSWRYRHRAYLALHKPAGVECSRAAHHPSVFSLLPAPLVERGVQCVGRLDHDTTGLLLLSDDGAFIHALTSPRRKVPKCYHVTLSAPLDVAQLTALRAGVTLRGERAPSIALEVRETGPRSLDMVIDEGKYHQVKRMVAAAGNHVAQLHRMAIGGLSMPASLAVGEWMWLEQESLDLLEWRV